MFSISKEFETVGKNTFNYILPFLLIEHECLENIADKEIFLKLIVEMRNTASHLIITGDTIQPLFVNMLKVYKIFGFDLLKFTKIKKIWKKIVEGYKKVKLHDIGDENIKINDYVEIIKTNKREQEFQTYFSNVLRFTYDYQKKISLFESFKNGRKTKIKTIYKYVLPIILWHQNMWYDSVHEIFREKIKNNLLFEMTTNIRHCLCHFFENVPDEETLRQIMENICIVQLAFGIDLYQIRTNVQKILKTEPSKFTFIKLKYQPRSHGEPPSIKKEDKEQRSDGEPSSVKKEAEEPRSDREPHSIKKEDKELRSHGEPPSIKKEDKELRSDGEPSSVKKEAEKPRSDGEPSSVKKKDKEPISDGEPQSILKDDVIKSIRDIIIQEYNPWKVKYFLYGSLLHHFVSTKITGGIYYTRVFKNASNNVEWSVVEKRFVIDNNKNNINKELIFTRAAPLFVWNEAVKGLGETMIDNHEQFSLSINEVKNKINCWIDNKGNENEETNILETIDGIYDKIKEYFEKTVKKPTECYKLFKKLVENSKICRKQKEPSFIFKIDHKKGKLNKLKESDIFRFCGLFYICVNYFEGKVEIQNDSFYKEVKKVTESITEFMQNEIVKTNRKKTEELQKVIKEMESIIHKLLEIQSSGTEYTVQKICSEVSFYFLPSIFK